MLRSEKVVYEPIGDLMEFRQMGEGCRFHVVRGQACFCEILRTFPGQRFNSVLFHLQMKQKPVGASGVAKGLQGGDVGAGQGHTVFGEVEYFAVPFEDFE